MIKWKIGYKPRGKNIFDLSDLKIWETPTGRYEADPFLFRNYIFYELYDYKKGVIAYSTISQEGISEPTVCLDLDFHLSYPNIFEHNGEVYMVPEMGSDDRIDLFRATEFPNKWEPVKIILDGYATEDNNIFFHNGWWWLMTSQSGWNLIILRSKDLLGDWVPHLTKTEKDCRSAGKVFKHKGMLVRPCQDSDETYGRAIIFKEITLPDYSAEAFDRIEPDIVPDIIGVHTFNCNEDFVVVDLKYKI